jgi:small-conductance mechanosensitive channel
MKMTTTEWIAVAAAVLGGFAVGVLGSRLLTSIIDRPSRPDPIRRAAPALASLVFSIGVVVGLIVALGIVSPSALEQMPKDIVAYIPRVLSAAIIVIAANVLSAFAQAALAPALGRLGPAVQRQTLSAVRITIMTLAVLLAVRQLGFDTTVINLGVAAIFFGLAGALMLLVALGGRRVASEVASTRILRKLFREGDTIQVDTIRGTVVAVHPTAVELDTVDGKRVLVPSSRFVADTVTIERLKADPAPTEP